MATFRPVEVSVLNTVTVRTVTASIAVLGLPVTQRLRVVILARCLDVSMLAVELAVIGVRWDNAHLARFKRIIWVVFATSHAH